MPRQLLFSITAKDFRVDTFRSGGKGGQNQNKTESGVRIVHTESGAVGECRETPSQHQNKRTAFRRLTESKKFKAWHAIRCSELMSVKTPEERLEEQMRPGNLRVEVKDDKDKWVPAGDLTDTE